MPDSKNHNSLKGLRDLKAMRGQARRARRSSYLGSPVEFGSPDPSLPVSRRRAREKGESWKLTDLQVANIREAAAHATRIGKPLNRFVTIDWELGGVVDHAAATASFLKALGEFLTYHGYPTAYVWTAENARTYGIHVHILLHADRSMARLLSNMHRAWLNAAGATYCKGLIKTLPVGGRTSAYLGAGRDDATSTYDQHAARVLAYILKCCSVEEARANGGHYLATSSRVVGRRCGHSHNVGKAERVRHARSMAEGAGHRGALGSSPEISA